VENSAPSREGEGANFSKGCWQRRDTGFATPHWRLGGPKGEETPGVVKCSIAPFESLGRGFAVVVQIRRQCCKFRSGTGVRREGVLPGENSGGHFEEFVDEPILTPASTPAQPPHLALPDYVHRLIALNRSLGRLEFPKPLLGVHSPFDCAMVLLDDVVQILDGSVAAPAVKRFFLLYVCDGRAIDRRQIRVDDAGLRMGSITQRLAKQPFAASASRNVDNMKSMVAPAESIARYR
jgi:hypothetical protein